MPAQPGADVETCPPSVGRDGEQSPRRAGRPTKLTPEVADKICQAIAGGNYREVAAAWAGIGERTLREWMQRGESPRSRYHDFRRRVLEAEQAAEIRAVGLIMAKAATDPVHAQWWLQRKHPERWGRQDRSDVKVTLTDQPVAAALVEILRRFIPEDKWDEFCGALDGDAGLEGIRQTV